LSQEIVVAAATCAPIGSVSDRLAAPVVETTA
jgi:hypothetical protein